MMPTLYLIRGLPGSGKSTLAKRMAEEKDIKYFEADMFFMENGEYKFDASKLGDAHYWCYCKVREELDSGNDVIVSNTFTTKSEIKNYADILFVDLVIIECTSYYGSIHNVPEAAMERMRKRWVPNSELGYFAEYKTV